MEDITQNNVIDKRELGENVHSQIIQWTENCDTKASITIAFIGIFASILFTSDYILYSIQKLITPILLYWKNSNGNFCVISLFIFLFLGLSLFFLGWTILLLFNVLKGKTICSEDSLIFFGKIKDHSFDEYYNKIKEATDESLLLDRFRQIYICSQRCNEKFISYNKAIIKAKWGILFLCLFMINLFIYNA